MARTRRSMIVAVIFSVFCLFSTAYATVRNVPANYPAIQNAIDDSNHGDTVVVNPGVYYENINFNGKNITVTSTNPEDPNIVKGTVITAVGNVSTVMFVTNEGRGAVLTGFTISGGYGTVNTSMTNTIYWGGGIYCYRSSPTISNNIITLNHGPDGTTGDIVGYGGGIGCIQSSALIMRNTITMNDCYAGGGIISYAGSDRIVSNVISDNIVTVGGGAVLFGGGQLLNNTIIGNSANVAGNIYAYSEVSLGQCLVSSNIICNAVSGGGLYLNNQDDIKNTIYNNLWGNTGGNYVVINDLTGINGNICVDPVFVDAEGDDYHLKYDSPCVNFGDPGYQAAEGESDFYGELRIFAGRVDIGADEYSDTFRPLANAGQDRTIGVISLPIQITLDGSGSSDPNGDILCYHWRQVGGAAVALSGNGSIMPRFEAFEIGVYAFELVVDNGIYYSFADTVWITVQNEVPIANAGKDQTFVELPETVALDGSASFDPEHGALTYHWKQIRGWNVTLHDANTATPSFRPRMGTYVFELVVYDGIQYSEPDTIGIIIGDNHAPVADAGASRYIAGGFVTLDGTGSYDQDEYGDLNYHWTQTSGTPVTLTGEDTATPLVSGFTPQSTIQKYTFELVVSDGNLISQPCSVTVTVVPNYGTNALVLTNPPFNPDLPTIVAFGGGNCSTGGGMTYGGVWNEKANWITVDSYSLPYTKYANMLMVYLSSVAPNYMQPIQTTGYSTGNMPAMEVAWYINTTYKDPRYAVNRVALMDAVCNNLNTRLAKFNAAVIDGERCWVDNYISNDPLYRRANFLTGAINIECNPYRSHSYPLQRYMVSSLSYDNGGLTAFAYLSVIGEGKNYQFNTTSNKYRFVINSAEDIISYNQSYTGKIMSPVMLVGPADGNTLDGEGIVPSCEYVENAVGYQLLFGAGPDKVNNYVVVSDTPNPPTGLITELPFEKTWWTIRAYDQFGSTIYADPRLIQIPENGVPVANAGADHVSYADMSGKASLTLDGSASSDPDGDALTYTWAWCIRDTWYEASNVNPTIELPIGVHVIQLMTSDGVAESMPDELVITVVAPRQGKLIVVPAVINRENQMPHIMAMFQLPEGVHLLDGKVALYPGRVECRMQRFLRICRRTTVVAWFDKDELMQAIDKNGMTELTIVGKQPDGPYIYGKDRVLIMKVPQVKELRTEKKNKDN